MVAAQAIAADPSHSVWVAASAGTGKTKVLTDRVLRLLLSGTPPSRILCLTYTNAAAAEMERRIMRQLGAWATMPGDVLQQGILALTGAPPTPDIVLHARKLFAEVLDTPSGFNIQTIHSFCQSLLQRFPLEAGVSPNFQVIDDKTAAELLQDVKLRLLSHGITRKASAGRELYSRPHVHEPQVGGATPDLHENRLSEAFQSLAWRFQDGSFTELLHELIGNRYQLATLFEEYDIDAAIAQIHRTLGVSPTLTENSLLAHACRDEAFDSASLRRIACILLEGGKTDSGRGQELATWLALSPEERVATFSSYTKCFLTQDGTPRKGIVSKHLSTQAPEAEQVMLREQERVLQLADQCKSLRIAELSGHVLHIADSIITHYNHLKQYQGVIDFSDMIHIAIRLLKHKEAAEWVRYKLDGGIDHILVDEAQDTSREQWEIIQTLCEEFFSGVGAEEKERTLFVVGDEKQSIYSFQGAAPHIFGEMHQHYAGLSGQISKPWQSVSLNVSFRSTAPVLTLVDALFNAPDKKQAVSFGEGEITHTPHRNGHAGLVEVWPVIAPPKEKEEIAPWPLPITRRDATSPAKQLAEKIADTVESWLKTKRFLPSKGRPVAAGDILVLVKRRNELVTHLVRALKQRNIPVAGMDRMVLTDHITVKDLVALGNFLLLPDDDLTLATVLKTPLINFTEEELFSLAYGRGDISLWQRLKQKQQENLTFQHAYHYLSSLLTLTDRDAPFELYHHVLEVLGGRKSFLSRLGQEASDPLDEFLALALDYEKMHTPSLQGFLHWLAQGKTEIKRDMDQGSGEIRIMTIHGAKGLQAPVVFLAEAMQPSPRRDRLLWSDALPLFAGGKDNENALCEELKEQKKFLDRQESLRLLYVALTRPEDELYICGYRGRNAPTEGTWLPLVQDALAAMPEVVKEEDVLRLSSPQREPIVSSPRRRGSTDGLHGTMDSRLRGNDKGLPPFLTTKPPLEAVPASLAPSRSGKTGQPVAASAQAVTRGIFIHKLLEILPHIPVEKQKSIALHLGRDYDLPAGEKEQTILDVLTLMEQPTLRALFSPYSRAEAPIIGTLDGNRISGQVDRLVVTSDEVLVIDYKTGAKPPENVAGIPAAYVQQMMFYRALLKEIYPRHTIRCFLLWTANVTVMEVGEGTYSNTSSG